MRLVIAVVAVLAASSIGAAGRAQARGAHSISHSIHGSGYRPLYADIVIDDNSGQVLHDVNADEPRHPASLTKIMTLYLLFGQLEAGALKLDSPLPVSAKAAQQAPTKLGLKPDQTLTVEDGSEGSSPNRRTMPRSWSAALGGSEDEFASS